MTGAATYGCARAKVIRLAAGVPSPKTFPTLRGVYAAVARRITSFAGCLPPPQSLVGVLLFAAGTLLLIWAAQAGISGIWQERQDRLLIEGALPAIPSSSPAFPDALALLRVDRLGWSVTVRKTTDSSDLARGAGWISGTALPGESGNIGIAGHRDTFFRPLASIRIGDELTLLTPSSKTRYKVTSTKVVDPNEVGVLLPSSTPTLTLVTCYPF